MARRPLVCRLFAAPLGPLFVAMGGFAQPSSALAQTAAETAPAEPIVTPPAVERSAPVVRPVAPYSGHILLGDLAWISTTGAGLANDSVPVALVGLGGYFVSGPAIHLAHHRPKTALASLLLRVGVPIAGAVLGAGIGGLARGRPDRQCTLSDPGYCRETGSWATYGAFGGGVAGVFVAPVVDAAVLARVAWFDKPVDHQAPTTAAASSPAPAPMFRWTGEF